jgi:hypothetical protein
MDLEDEEMPRKSDKRKRSTKETRLERVCKIASLVVMVTTLCGNPVPWVEQGIVALIQGPPVTYGEIESLRVPVPTWAVQPERPPI